MHEYAGTDWWSYTVPSHAYTHVFVQIKKKNYLPQFNKSNNYYHYVIRFKIIDSTSLVLDLQKVLTFEHWHGRAIPTKASYEASNTLTSLSGAVSVPCLSPFPLCHSTFCQNSLEQLFCCMCVFNARLWLEFSLGGCFYITSTVTFLIDVNLVVS